MPQEVDFERQLACRWCMRKCFWNYHLLKERAVQNYGKEELVVELRPAITQNSQQDGRSECPRSGTSDWIFMSR